MMIRTLSPFHLGSASATLVIAASAICFGLVPLFVRELQGLGTGPATIALYRYGFSALFLLPFLPLQREKRGGALLLMGSGIVFSLSLIGYLEALGGALDVAASDITEGMKLAAAHAIAEAVRADELGPEHIIPSVFDREVSIAVARAVAEAAVADGVDRRPLD